MSNVSIDPNSIARSSLEKQLLVSLLTPRRDGGWGEPAMFWGLPGVGKTSMIRSFAGRLGMPTIVLSPALMGDGAFGVVPVPAKVGGDVRIQYPRPDWTSTFEGLGQDGELLELAGLVYIDEITCAPPSMQAPLLGLLEDRKVGDHKLHSRVRVIAAGNPPAVAASGWDLAAPVASRMAHFEWPNPSAAEWSDFILGDVFAQEAGTGAAHQNAIGELEQMVRDNWSLVYSQAAAEVAAFAQRNPGVLHKMPGEGDASAGRAWPCHRTWDKAVRAKTTAAVLGFDQVTIDATVTAFVGAGAATEFAAWRVALNLPDPMDVLDGKVQFKHDPVRLDRTMATFMACAAVVTPAPADTAAQALRLQRANALWGLLGNKTATGGALDATIPTIRALVRADDQIKRLPNAAPVLVAAMPALQAAGYSAR